MRTNKGSVEALAPAKKRLGMPFRIVAFAALAALAPAAASSLAQEAAEQQEDPVQARARRTFRLLTFETGSSGPRLGTTVGTGEQEIVDVQNAIR